jgi:hypothetical protein
VVEQSASGKYWVDTTDGISEDLAVCVSNVACMLVTRVRNSTTRRNVQIYGKVGLIKRGQDTILVTSLHNLISEDGYGSDRLVAKTVFLHLSNVEDYDVDFDAISSRTWKRDL